MKKILTYVGIVLGFLVLAYAFVPEVLSGKIVNQSDISGWQGTSHEMMEWNAAHPDDKTAWTDAMFGGMPTVTIHVPSDGDWTQKIYDFLLLGKRPATYLFISLLGAFLLLLTFGVNIWVAVGGAIAITFCSYNIQIIQVGHNTKMQALAFLPWALAAFVFTYKQAMKEGKWLPLTLMGSAFFGLAISFQIKANHPQISWYLALMLILYAIFLLGWVIKNNKQLLKRFFITSGLLILLGLAGVGTNAFKMLPVWEYTPYSMRGGTSEASTEEARNGLDLEYATAWSYGWEELPNMFIPNYNGGSSYGDPGKNSEAVKLLREAGYEAPTQLPLYWGPQPFTAGPMYMGAICFFLFILGLFVLKGRDKWWLLLCSVLAILLAVGNHFMLFTKVFYTCAPLYNKFRTVSMALTILQFTLPVFGFLALDKVLKSGVKTSKILLAGAWSLALILFFALMQSIVGTFTSASDAGQPDMLVDALEADRHSLLWADAMRSLLFIAAAVASVILARKKKVLGSVLVAGLVLIDMFTVGKRYLNKEDFVSPREFNSQFAKRPVDEIILEDPDPSYRVLDLTTNIFNDSHPSYWHKSVGGYSPAKMQIYQEYIDAHLHPEIDELTRELNTVIKNGGSIQDLQESIPQLEGLSKLNCRYFIIDGGCEPLMNPFACGPAWFQSEAELEGPAGEDCIQMESYAPNKLVYTYDSKNGGSAVFSEVFYPKGWTATLEDGNTLPIYKTEEILRGIDLPAGHHTLTMSFAPESYSKGRTISLICSILLILTVLATAIIPALKKDGSKS